VAEEILVASALFGDSKPRQFFRGSGLITSACRSLFDPDTPAKRRILEEAEDTTPE
jgi:hypothetical protein